MAKGFKNADEPSGEHDPLLEHVGARIRAARKRAKLKQSEVAAAIGSGQSYIVDIESGKANLTLRMLSRMAAALGVSPASLLLEGDLANIADQGVFDRIEADRERFVRIADLLRAVMSELTRSTDALEKAHALSVEPAADHQAEGPS